MAAEPLTPRLRPLGVGEILDVGIKIYTRNWLTLWKAVVFVVLPAQILVSLVEASATPKQLSSLGAFRSFTPKPIVLTRHEIAVYATGLGVALLLTLVAGQLAQAACLRTVTDTYLGHDVDWRASLRYAFRRLPALVAISFLTLFLVFLGAILCIVPGIYLWGAFYVAVPVLLIEGSGPIRSLGRSRRLVRGRWWGTVGVALVGFLIIGVVTTTLTTVVVGFADPSPSTATGFILNTLASTVASMLTTPVAAAFATVLYIDLRVRKEGFDLYLLAQRLGVDREPGTDIAAPDFLPEAPAYTSTPPPYWPPPAGWTPDPFGPAAPEPPPPPPEYEQPPFWPPPPGWQPGRE